MIPDIDLLIPFVEHRGPSHSILTAIVILIPIIVLFRRSAFPYLIALLQHSMLGDFLTGNVQLFWPLTLQPYGIGMDIRSPVNIAIEWITFMAMLSVMLKTRDLQLLFKPNNLNMILVVPTLTVLLPAFLAFPLKVPTALIIPHLIMLVILSTSMLTDIKRAISRLLLQKQPKKACKNGVTNTNFVISFNYAMHRLWQFSLYVRFSCFQN